MRGTSIVLLLAAFSFAASIDAPSYVTGWSQAELNALHAPRAGFPASLSSCVPPPSRLAVNLTQLVVNWRALQAHAGPDVTVAPTLKAEAYGHGSVATALALQAAGAHTFMVAALTEAVALRRAGVRGRVLVMSYTPPADAAVAAGLGIDLTVFDTATVQAYATAVRGAGGVGPLSVHIKVDSGMGRMGVLPGEVQDLALALQGAADVLEVVAAYTHYSRADDDVEWTRQQRRVFGDAMAAALPAVPLHTCNSAALLLDPTLCGGIARAGIALYGGQASGVAPLLPGMGYALTWTAAVAQVKTLPAGHAVGYGNTYVTPAPETMVVLPVGYSNGLRRGPSNQGWVLLHGTRCPIRGRVSMEKTVVSIQHLVDAGVEVRVGDAAVLLGAMPAAEAAVSADGATSHSLVTQTPAQSAAAIGTIDYEVLTAVLPHVPRWGGEACGVQYLWPEQGIAEQ